MKYLKYLICLLLIPFYAHAGVIQSGTVTQANAKKSLVDGAAFVDIAVDLSAYASSDAAVSHKYEFRLIDSAGKIARGYIGASGAGETLSGTEEITDPLFDNAASWNLGTGWSIAGGQATANNPAINVRVDEYIANSTGTLLKGSAITSALTAGSMHLVISHIKVGSFTSAGTHEGYATSFDIIVRLYGIGAGSAGDLQATVDSYSVKQVTDCSTNGVHILSTKTGSTQNWAEIQAGFNYNDVSDYTYQILVSGAAGSW